jgi:hypothetical protein
MISSFEGIRSRVNSSQRHCCSSEWCRLQARGLGHLGEQGLGVAQQQALQQAGAIELLLQQAAIQPVGVSRGLHHRRTGGRIAPHEQRNADDALIAHPGGFGRCAGSQDVVEGDDGGGREEGVPLLPTRFVQDVTEPHRDQLQMRHQGLEVRPGQGGEKVILMGTMEC